MSNSNASSQSLTHTENYLNVKGGKIWYKIVGEGNAIPIITIHGGPGGTSYYLNPLAELGKNRPVIFYDQLGCGRSDRITDTTLMTVERYVEELHTLINHLGLKEFYLYGQSWGTTIATEYYYRYPEGVEALILSSPFLSTNLWLEDANILLKTMPYDVQNAVNKSIDNNDFSTEEFQSAMMKYYEAFVCRKKPWSEDIEQTFSEMGIEVYSYMFGPSEFICNGILKDYSGISKLNNIKVPVLFIAGEYDEARPETVKYYQSLIPNSEYFENKGAGHITMHDAPEDDIIAISSFLNKLEKNK